jgi:ankyrin repeat protein
MLKQKGDVNAPQPDGATALHWATHWDDMETVELLLSAGAAVDVKNDYGVTPISLASENANLLVVQRLIKAGANVNAATSTGETPLMTAVRAGSIPVVKALIAAGADVNVRGGGREQSALHWAVAQKQLEMVRVLIDAKADLDARTELRREFVSFSRGNPQGGRLTGIADHTLESDGTRPGLRWINKGGLTPLLFAARDGDLESVTMLIAAGANINATTGIGETALMLAARNDHTGIALYLLEKGADPNIVEAGHSALHFAVARKNQDLVKALIANKADVNVRLTRGQPDPDGNLRYNQLPEYLLGATPYLLATALNEMDTMRVLVAAGADPKTPMADGTTPTMASMGVFPGVFTFIPFVKIGERGAQGDNTAYFQRKRLFSEAKVLETMKLAVEFSGGEDINAARGPLTTYHVGNSRTLVGRDVGDTALHIAAADKYPTVVEFLISKGARTDIKDRRGLTPLAVAKHTGRQFITGGDNGEKIGDEKIATLLTSLGAQE